MSLYDIQLMRRKKAEGEMMEEAIQKASQLIALLQKENHDFKRKVERLQRQNQMLKKQNQEVRQKNQQMGRECEKIHSQMEERVRQVEQAKAGLEISDEQLKRRISTNKDLHQKISNLTARLKEKSRECNQEKTKLLSLQNQNQYLLKKLAECDQKENIVIQKVTSVVSQRENQLKEAIRLKQAFARRCEQLKADNAQLLLAAADYKQRAIDGPLQPAVDDLRLTLKPVRKQPNIVPLQSLLAKIIQDSLGVQPASTIEKQAQQLGSFIQYRMSHLEKLWQGIIAKMEDREWKKISNLRDLHTACQRMHSYVAELLSQSK